VITLAVRLLEYLNLQWKYFSLLAVTKTRSH